MLVLMNDAVGHAGGGQSAKVQGRGDKWSELKRPRNAQASGRTRWRLSTLGPQLGAQILHLLL